MPNPAREKPLLFVVDDDADLRQMLQRYLNAHGFDVVGLPTADDMLHRLKRLRPDLVVLDLMMPGTGGLQAVRKLRAASDDLPLILLTARSDADDRIVGLETGADDYLGKPFDPRELVARIHAVLRRRVPSRAAFPDDGKEKAVGDWVLDARTRTLRNEGREVRLTSAEFALLRVLVAHPFTPLSRERLLEMTKREPGSHTERSIDVRILRLRRVIEADPENPRILQTVRGVGYVFTPPSQR